LQIKTCHLPEFGASAFEKTGGAIPIVSDIVDDYHRALFSGIDIDLGNLGRFREIWQNFAQFCLNLVYDRRCNGTALTGILHKMGPLTIKPHMKPATGAMEFELHTAAITIDCR